MSQAKVAIVAGFGPGLGHALSRRLLAAGYRVAGLSRSGAATSGAASAFASDSGAEAATFIGLSCDVTDPAAVTAAVAVVEQQWEPVSVYIHNPAMLVLKPFLETGAAEFEALWRVTCLAAVHGAQAVLPGMVARGEGALLFIGATASVKGGPRAAAFASAKFALRGLAQSLARAYGPAGVHVAHLIIDGVIRSERAQTTWGMAPDQCLSPDAIADTCLHVIRQDRSAWTQELDIRPNVETF